MNKLKDIIKNMLPDKIFLTLRFRKTFGRWINWRNPVTYNEKLQWMKVYYRRKDLGTFVDKYEVKDFVAKTIGKDYIIPTLGVWDRPDDIQFDLLPNQFVLKCTHDSGSIIICKDKSKFDQDMAINSLKRSMSRDLFNEGREYPYKLVKPRVIAEKYMEDTADGELRDYKFFVFDGKATTIYIVTDRMRKDVDTCIDYYDMDFNHLDFRSGNYPNTTKKIEKPAKFDEMKKLAEQLGTGFPHVRVDFYQVDGKVYFGELTFFTSCGFLPFVPEEWDYKFGEMFPLPKPIR